jgi:hypothetical protein
MFHKKNKNKNTRNVCVFQPTIALIGYKAFQVPFLKKSFGIYSTTPGGIKHDILR